MKTCSTLKYSLEAQYNFSYIFLTVNCTYFVELVKYIYFNQYKFL